MAVLRVKGRLIALGCVALLCYVSATQYAGGAMKPKQYHHECERWQAKVDPSINLSRDDSGPSTIDEAEILRAMECLLQMEGRTTASTFSSATVGYNLSQRFAAPSIEVAALFYASYLFYEKWQHAGAMILMDKQGNKNTTESIKTAYEAYRSWLKKVRETGLERAKKQGLDPLDGTGIRWY